MNLSGRIASCAQALFAIVFFVVITVAGARAESTSFLSGTITSNGKPVTGANVTATGANVTLHAQTNASGIFTISAVPIGTYDVDVSAPGASSELRVDVTSIGAKITVNLSGLKTIGRTSVTSRPPVSGSGTDLSLSGEILARSPASGSLPALLIQLPGAARGANGVVHINGDHGDINYIVDGAPIPQELNREVGSEFDSNDIAFLETIQGAYPAQYGEKFASVVNIDTRNGSGPPGFTGDFRTGSYALDDATIGYHAKVGAGSLVVTTREERSDRGLDPPNFDSPHNNFSTTSQFLRYTLPTGNDFLNLTVSHSFQTFQVPNDVASGEPANTDDNETQDDTFATLQYRKPIGDHGSLSFGPSYKRSTIVDSGDPNNDFAFGEAGAVAAGNAPTNCANALASSGPVVNGIVTNPIANPNVAYSNATCGYSLFGDRTAIDVGGNLDYDNKSPHHDVRFGGIYDATHVAKTYAVSLQPGNFLAPIFTPATPDAPFTVVDNTPNVGHLSAFYLQDTWKMGDLYQLDYGARDDIFTVSSTDFNVGYGQVSPRIKFTRFLGTRASVYAFYGRFFTPFSLENVGPTAAFNLNLPLQTTPAQFDLKPQRDSDYELGGHLGVGPGDLGLRVMQKDATDLIDDTQVGVTPLHQDINFALGRIATQTAYYQVSLPNAGRFYASLTHTYSVNKGCETQLLAPCFGVVDDWTPADHDQRVDLSSGFLSNDHHGGWLAIDGEYGSGLSESLNPVGITCAGPNYASPIGGPCKTPPHLTFDGEKGFGLGRGMALTARIQNILNDRYLVTFLNAQGNHYAPPRTFELGLRLNTK